MIYKKSYTGMFLFNFGLYFISLLIGLSILYFIEVGNSPIYNFLIAAAAMIGIVLLVGIIIDFILSIFSKDKIYMDNEYIEYKNDKYFVSHIKFVEFYIGSIGKTMHEDANVTIYFENEKIIRFKNPPLKLIIKLRKITGKKWFRIIGLKKLFFIYIITVLVLICYALISKLF